MSPARSAHVEPAASPSVEPRETAAPSLVDSLLAAPVVHQTFGVVEGAEERVLLVRAGAELVRATRSKSCLVEPARGDTVLVARSDHHGSYVLAVLSSSDEASSTTVEIDGDLTLRSKRGKVAIAGGETVSIVAGRNVAVAAPELTASTVKASLFADTLSYVGRSLDAQVERVRYFGKKLESVVDVVTARMKHSHRTIEEVERIKAKELHLRAEDTLNVHGKNTLMTAEKLVKFDGEQIHLG
ncbi:MAG TPA: DUF3540 domain-containing protein [Polyangiaceae bacterium]|nr:DUF3540 domain-containing protein [Polyangiaceae bacterium]